MGFELMWYGNRVEIQGKQKEKGTKRNMGYMWTLVVSFLSTILVETNQPKGFWPAANVKHQAFLNSIYTALQCQCSALSVVYSVLHYTTLYNTRLHNTLHYTTLHHATLHYTVHHCVHLVFSLPLSQQPHNVAYTTWFPFLLWLFLFLFFASSHNNNNTNVDYPT